MKINKNSNDKCLFQICFPFSDPAIRPSSPAGIDVLSSVRHFFYCVQSEVKYTPFPPGSLKK